MDRFPLHLIPVTIEQAWGLLEYDWELRLHLLAPELSQEFQPKLNAIYQGKKRSDSHYIRARIELELEQADYTAKRYFEACCEAWDAQHRPRCRAFFRAVLDFVLIPSFDLRQAFTFGDIQRRYPKEPDLSVILGDFKRRLDKVRSRWATLIEIASRQNEYDQRATRERQSQQAQTGHARTSERISDSDGTFTWEQLERRFLEIQGNATEQKVSVWFITRELKSGVVTRELYPGGPHAVQVSFDSLCSVAARKLGYSGNDGAHEYWLNRLFDWVYETGLDKDKSLFQRAEGTSYAPDVIAKDEGIYTDRIAELAARFCVHLIGAAPATEQTISAPAPTTSEKVRLADDHRSIRIENTEYRLTKYQGRMMAVLFRAWKDGKPYVSKRELAAAIESTTSDPRNAWKASPLWQKVVRMERERFWLDFDLENGSDAPDRFDRENTAK